MAEAWPPDADARPGSSSRMRSAKASTAARRPRGAKWSSVTSRPSLVFKCSSAGAVVALVVSSCKSPGSKRAASRTLWRPGCPRAAKRTGDEKNWSKRGIRSRGAVRYWRTSSASLFPSAPPKLGRSRSMRTSTSSLTSDPASSDGSAAEGAGSSVCCCEVPRTFDLSWSTKAKPFFKKDEDPADPRKSVTFSSSPPQKPETWRQSRASSQANFKAPTFFFFFGELEEGPLLLCAKRSRRAKWASRKTRNNGEASRRLASSSPATHRPTAARRSFFPPRYPSSWRHSAQKAQSASSRMRGSSNAKMGLLVSAKVAK
mmetsp:Transcript_12558/g.41094  ORF Transcript_12558/g.41094 Transcript_12558/m.41094 type:complete len:316 (-) Transcript_12558:1974-2921(-)